MLYASIAWMTAGVALFVYVTLKYEDELPKNWRWSLTFQVAIIASMVLWPVLLWMMVADRRKRKPAE